MNFAENTALNYFNYFTEIEETFVRRRGKHLLLSPIDWAMMEIWQESGIPLHIVIRGIESVFDVFDKAPGPRTIKGLMFCREEVEAQHEEWLKMQTGKADVSETEPEPSFSLEAISEHIDRVASQIGENNNELLAEDLSRARSRLDELKQDLNVHFELIDQSLMDIEKFIDQALPSKVDKAHLKQVEKEISDQLRPYRSGMDADVYKTTFDMMLLKRIREEENIPRLSLFYL